MKKQRIYSSTNVVKRFPKKGGWVYVSINQTYTDLGMKKPKWGLVPATITVGNTTWEKSLLPFGDETLFISLSEKIRKAEEIEVGDTVTVIVKV